MFALATATLEGRIPNAEIALVISDQPNAGGLDLARELGIKAEVVERRDRDRLAHDREILSNLISNQVDLVCLAGYMRVLSPTFIAAFRNRILNIHPSLLPSFPGLGAQKQALEHGVKWSGCTVHFVDESLDCGPIIAQRIVPVLDGDTEEALSARILSEEHRLYPEAVVTVIRGEYEIIGRRVVSTKRS